MLDELLTGLRPVKGDLWNWWQKTGLWLLLIYLVVLHIPWLTSLLADQARINAWSVQFRGPVVFWFTALSISLRPILFGLIWLLAARCALASFRRLEELPLPSKWMLMRLKLGYSLLQGLPVLAVGTLFHFIIELARNTFEFHPQPFTPISEFFPVCCWFIILSAFYYPYWKPPAAFFGFSMLTPVIMTFSRGGDINELHPARFMRNYMDKTDINLAVTGCLISLILVLVLLYSRTRGRNLWANLAYGVLLFSTVVYFNAGLLPHRATSFTFEPHAGLTRFQVTSLCLSLTEFPVTYYPSEIIQDTKIWITNQYISVEPSSAWIWVAVSMNAVWFMLLILGIFYLVLREWPQIRLIRDEPAEGNSTITEDDNWR